MILGYSVDIQRSDGSYRTVAFFEAKCNESTLVSRGKALAKAREVGGWIEPVGILSDEEILLELERSKND